MNNFDISKKEVPTIKFPLNIEIADIVEKKQLEFVFNRIQPGQAIVVRKPTRLGFAEKVFIVHHDGSGIKIHELK